MSLLKGKKGLIMGVANDRSIAWGIAKKLSEHGAELAFTYLGDALKKRVVPLAQSLKSNFTLSCDVEKKEDVVKTFDDIKNIYLNKYKYSYSKKNQGVCVAYNEATKLAKNNYIVLAHDDMYFCPGWDTVFNNEIKNIDVVTIICSLLDEISPRENGSSYSDLITFVKDRPGHDFRYAIDAGKIQNDLGWSPNESFETGIRKTIHWYLDNQNWWKSIQNNNYRQERLGVIKK